MADGEINLILSQGVSDRLVVAAREAGKPVVEFAAELIGTALEDDWSESERRLAEYDRTGESVPADEAMDRFEKRLAARFAANK